MPLSRYAYEEKKGTRRFALPPPHAATCYTAVYKHVRIASVHLCINFYSLLPPPSRTGTSAASVGALAQRTERQACLCAQGHATSALSPRSCARFCLQTRRRRVSHLCAVTPQLTARMLQTAMNRSGGNNE